MLVLISSMRLKIEDISPRDIAELHNIETRCFSNEAFTKEQIVQLLTEYNSIGLSTRVDGKIVGFIIGAVYVEKDVLHGHIATIDVLPERRRQRVGQSLLEAIEEIFRKKKVAFSHLEVREDNAAAIGLYKQMGYSVVRRLKNYYGAAHGLYLRKALT